MRRVTSWFILGVCASVVELGLLRLLYETLGWPLAVATAVAAEVLILAKFVVADHWVFGHPRPAWGRLLRYHGASAGALVVYWLVTNGLAALGGVPYVIAFIVGTGGAFSWSLFTNFFWVWSGASRVNAGDHTGR